MLYIIYCYRSLIPDLLRHLSSHPLLSLHCLCVLCKDDSEVRALTTFLPQCTNLHTLRYESGWTVSERAEKEMWEAAVRSCKNLEEVRIWGRYSAVSCDRLMSVLKELSESEGIQTLKLKKIVKVSKYSGDPTDYSELNHLLPALQQQSQQQSLQHKCCCLLF